jgi:hypothetical protein
VLGAFSLRLELLARTWSLHLAFARLEAFSSYLVILAHAWSFWPVLEAYSPYMKLLARA